MKNASRIAALVIATLIGLVASAPPASARTEVPPYPSIPGAPWATDLAQGGFGYDLSFVKKLTADIKNFELGEMSDEQTFVEALKLAYVVNHVAVILAADDAGGVLPRKLTGAERVALNKLASAASAKISELKNIWRNHDIDNRGPDAWEKALDAWLATGNPPPFDPRQK